MKVIATFVRTTYVESGKSPIVTQWRLKDGPYELRRILGPKHQGHFLEQLMQHKRAEILQSKSSVVWELFQMEVEAGK